MTARPEYQALVDGLPALMREFDCSIATAALADVGTFMAATEHVDRILDAIDDAGSRHRFGAAIVAVVEGAGGDLTTFDRADGPAPALGARLRALHDLVERRGVRARFVALVQEALVNTERMRTTLDTRVYLDCIEREGQLTVELALLFITPLGSTDGGLRFVSFFRAVADVANLVDKLVDARSDARRGEIALHAGIVLHARLLARTLRRIPGAMARHPRPARFVAWGIGWLPRLSEHRATESGPRRGGPA